ncbi:hypothetical protein [Flavobacterium sp.]|uniref:hypothetical protein n=1 Tax=Flavobacterium sp. TaxID=239 RepID=UPI00286B616C|nr:hypothetical protein [Flavobacterium sp.]
MRRILIDSALEKHAENFSNNLFKGRRADFSTPANNLQKLFNDLSSKKHLTHRLYVEHIINNYHRIVKANPDEIQILIKEFKAINIGTILNQNVPNKKIKFHQTIVNAMRYDALRDYDFNSYLKASGIKSCIYCNSQSTVVIDYKYYNNKTKKKVRVQKAKLELDHYYPKSKYPFLCTSFYNLYPVCGNCNRSKSSNNINFNLYTDDPNKLDIFSFKIDDNSVLDYWLSLNKEDLKVYFQDINGDVKFLNDYNKMFAIQGIYDTQKDIAEELVHKAKVYSSAYKSDLVDNFKALFPDKAILNRLIIGNYDKPDEIHKRPMAKYVQDIARDLKIIS